EDARVGIQMEGFQESGEEGGDVGMHQVEHAQADDHEEQACQYFLVCNQPHAGMMLLRHYAFIVVRLLEHRTWASYRFVEEKRSIVLRDAPQVPPSICRNSIQVSPALVP